MQANQLKEELLRQLFEKAQESGAPNTKNGVCKAISEGIEEQFNFNISSRTLAHYYDWMQGTKEPIQVRKDIWDILARYVGYMNYEVFVRENRRNGTNKKRFLFLIFILLGSVIFLTIWWTRPQCMVWVEDHYETTVCDGSGTLAIDPVALKKMTRVEVDCDTTVFFDQQGKPLIFYYKTREETLEYYTYLGMHPVHGKPLKPITGYMIQKYPCQDR